MLVLLLTLTMGIPFPFCLFRMKKFGIPMKRMVLIYVVFSMVGLVGANIGAAISGGAITGRRLYGLMLFDTIALLVMSRLMRIPIVELGDFIAVPIMAVCASAKLDCLMNNCCRGFLIENQGAHQVYFPSAILEMVIWSIFVILLLLIERRKYAEGLLWPLTLVWFGAMRYLVDFLRGSEWGKITYLFSMPAGRFWSLVVLCTGIILLNYCLRIKLGRRPKMLEVIRSIVGMNVAHSTTGKAM